MATTHAHDAQGRLSQLQLELDTLRLADDIHTGAILLFVGGAIPSSLGLSQLSSHLTTVWRLSPAQVEELRKACVQALVLFDILG